MTPPLPPLASLIARLEAAAGPDRELDAEIALRLIRRWEQVQRRVGGDLMWNAAGTEVLFYAPPIPWSESWVPVPRFTASVDAALTLGRTPKEQMAVLQEAMRLLSREGAWHMRFPDERDLARLPLAICAAALRARAAGGDDGR